MSRIKIAITIDRKMLKQVDGLISKNVFANQSQVIQAAVAEKHQDVNTFH